MAPLESRQARELAKAARQITHWTTKRDELIVAALEAGASLRAVAEATGLSNPGVMKIRDRHTNEENTQP